MHYLLTIFLASIIISNTFKGRVVDRSGAPIPGANIELLDSQRGTSSDEDGFFTINNPNQTSIRVSHIGYSSETINFTQSKKNVSSKKSNYRNITLFESQLDTNPVVVTGLRRNSYIKDVPIKTHVITMNDIKSSGSSSVKDLLEWAIPNIQNVMSSHAGISNNNVKIQGLDNKYMLFLVDGARISGEFAGNLDFNMLNLSNVERIEVIEGGMSSLYGSSAIGGVVNIISKRNKSPFMFEFSLFHDNPVSISKYINLGFNFKNLNYNLNLSNQGSDGYDLTPHDVTVTYPLKTLEEYSSFTINHNLKYYINNYISINLSYKNYKNKIYQYQNHFVNTIVDDSNELYPNYYYSSLRNNNPWFEDNEYKLDLNYNKNNSSLILRYHEDDYNKTNYFYNYTELECDNPDENYFCRNQNNLIAAEFTNAKNYNQNYFIKYDLRYIDNIFTVGYEKNKNDYSSFNIYKNSTGDINNDGQCGEGLPWDPSDCLVESIFGGTNGTKEYIKESFFLGSQLNILKNNTLSLSIRDVDSKNYGNDKVYSIAYMIKGDKYSYRANHSKGFRIPSIKELYYDFQSHPPPIMGNPNLKPTTNDYYSLSIEKRNINTNGSIEVYYNNVIDMIGTNYADSDDNGEDDIIMYNNFNQVDISGLNFHYELANQKNIIKFVYNYTNPKSDNSSALELISKHSARIKYSRKIIKDRFSLFLNTKFSGKKFIMYGSEKLYLESYSITDIILSLNINKDTYVNYGIKNLFNYRDKRRLLEDSYLNNILSTYEPGLRLFIELKTQI